MTSSWPSAGRVSGKVFIGAAVGVIVYAAGAVTERTFRSEVDHVRISGIEARLAEESAAKKTMAADISVIKVRVATTETDTKHLLSIMTRIENKLDREDR